MSDDTYAARMNGLVEDERKKNAFEKKDKPKFKMSDMERRFASAMISLRENPDFKIYMELESKLIGERMGEAFKLPSKDLIETDSYGEKMAFNHGRYHQMKYAANTRVLLQKLYAEEKRNEQEDNDGKD